MPPTAQSTAFAISGEPLTRPPISSVSLRRFCSSGDSPITTGRIFAAACAHDEASVVEQPAACVPCPGESGFGLEGNWPHANETPKPRSSAVRKNLRITIMSFSLQMSSRL